MYPSLILGGPPADPDVAEGLVDLTFARTAKLTEVTALNAKMEALTPTCLALASDTVFVGNAPTDFVHSLSTTADYFLGTFTHTDDSRYLMIVNEDLSTTPNRTVTVTLDATDLPGSDRTYRLFDVYGNTRIPAGGRNPSRPQFPVTLRPGDGTLYRIEPDRPGMVTVTGLPARVDVDLTAQLTDPDGELAGRDWHWESSADGTTWTMISGAEETTYQPTRAQIGQRLRATVTYRDGASTNTEDRKSAQSAATEPVVDVPDAPGNLTAVAGDRQLTLSWETPANNGSALTRFQYRRSTDGGATWSPDWSRATIIPRSGPATTSHEFGGLTNGTAYTFEIRARNGAGDGAAAQVTATPLGPPGNLRATPGDGQVTLSWGDPSPANPTIAEWQYRSKRSSATTWGPWQTEESATARQATVGSLEHGHEYQFEVQAINSDEDEGPSASASAVLYRVAFNHTVYVLIEGGAPVAGQTGSHEVQVQVLLTPRPPRQVQIPLTVGGGTAAAADYRVRLPASRVLTFARESSKTFTLEVNRDTDTVDETLELGFGDLPAGVRSGGGATVTLYDTPIAPSNVEAEPGHLAVTLSWDNPNNAGIRGWQYQKRLGRPGNDWEDWADAGSGATTTEYAVPNLTDGLKYLFKVRAFNTRGYGAASAKVEATPSGLQATAYNGAVGLAWVDPGSRACRAGGPGIGGCRTGNGARIRGLPAGRGRMWSGI